MKYEKETLINFEIHCICKRIQVEFEEFYEIKNAENQSSVNKDILSLDRRYCWIIDHNIVKFLKPEVSIVYSEVDQ